jgi:hypothetical protein
MSVCAQDTSTQGVTPRRIWPCPGSTRNAHLSKGHRHMCDIHFCMSDVDVYMYAGPQHPRLNPMHTWSCPGSTPGSLCQAGRRLLAPLACWKRSCGRAPGSCCWAACCSTKPAANRYALCVCAGAQVVILRRESGCGVLVGVVCWHIVILVHACDWQEPLETAVGLHAAQQNRQQTGGPFLCACCVRMRVRTS